MAASNVVYLPLRSRHETSTPDIPYVITALRAALLRETPKPSGLLVCLSYLQESVDQLPARQMAMRALQNLRMDLFAAPGRDAEMSLLWREALATACYSRVLALHGAFDVSLLTGAGLLHRAGEIAALRALAEAELDAGQRLQGPIMQQILEARDDELVTRVTRSWSLPCEMGLLIQHWREEQNEAQRSEAVNLLTMAQALATELVHAATFTPGLVEAARQELGLPSAIVDCARTATPGITALLTRLAPALQT